MSEDYLYPFAKLWKTRELPFTVMRHNQFQYQPHHHDFHELVCVLSGTGKHEIEGRCHNIYMGDVFTIPPDVTHAYKDSQDLLLLNVIFLESALDGIEDDMKKLKGYSAFFRYEPTLRNNYDFKARLKLSGKDLLNIQMLAMKLETEVICKQPGFITLAKAYFNELIVFVSRKYESSQHPYSRKMVALSKMLEFVEENYHKHITRESIVQTGAVSVSTATRLFNEIMKKGIFDYLMDVRINNAKKLLLTTDFTVSEIAFKCGFSDANYFSLMFKRSTGMPPTAFRQKGRN